MHFALGIPVILLLIAFILKPRLARWLIFVPIIGVMFGFLIFFFATFFIPDVLSGNGLGMCMGVGVLIAFAWQVMWTEKKDNEN